MLVRKTSERVRAGALSIIVLAWLCLAPAATQADLLPYSQNFEGMLQSDPGALSNDGWLVYGNVFTPQMTFLYGYGAFPAPNGGPPAFSVLVTDQGGPTQGSLQLSVLSDYENLDHANGNLIESNVFQERTIAAANVGETWYFEFDAKRGNLGGGTTALAFIKTLSPPTYALTNFLLVDMTAIPDTWGRYSISIPIEAALSGQILQFGFANTATHYEPSGVYYDNVSFSQTSTVGVGALATGPALELRITSNPALGRNAQTMNLTVPRDDRVTVRVYDVAGGRVTTLVDRELHAGVHQVTWRGDDDAGRTVAPGVYLAEVVAGSGRASVKLSRLQ